MEAGQGTPLVHLHGAGGLRLTRAHDLLARHFAWWRSRCRVGDSPGTGPIGRSPRWRARSRRSASTPSTLALVGERRLAPRCGALLGLGGTPGRRDASGDRARSRARKRRSPVDPARTSATRGSRSAGSPAWSTPTLVLFGTRDDVIPPAMGSIYKASMPNCHSCSSMPPGTPSALIGRRRSPRSWSTSSSATRRSSSAARRR